MKTGNVKFVSCLVVLLVSITNAAPTQSGNTELNIPRYVLEVLTNTPGRTEGTGTYFEVTDSEYLNVAVETDVIVNLALESVPDTITIHLSASIDADSTLLSIMGLDALTTYYMYVDDYHNSYSFVTDEYGCYWYYQDLTASHTIFIQPRPSTKFVPSDPDIGIWDPVTRIYTLTTNVYETIQIDEGDLILEGGGFSVVGYDTGHGIYMNAKSGVTITNLNITDFTDGIYLNGCSGNIIISNNCSFNRQGIYVIGGNGNRIEGNSLTQNTIGLWLKTSVNNEVLANNVSDNTAYGIYLYSYSTGNVIANNTVDRNAQLGIEMYYNCDYNEIVCNEVSYNDAGIDVYYSNDNEVAGNTFNANDTYGIMVPYYANRNVISSNTSSNNVTGLFFGVNCSENQIYNNNFIDNSIQIEIISCVNNIFNLDAPTGGNHYSNWTEPDVDGDGFVDDPYVIKSGILDYLPLVEPAPSGCNNIPVANAGSDQAAVMGDTVTLDGSGSYDNEEDLLTYYWSFTSMPDGSMAVIDDPYAEITSFVPDLSGQYIVSLVVNDGYSDSESDEAIIIVITPEQALNVTLIEIQDLVVSFDTDILKNKTSQTVLLNKLDAVMEAIEEGFYEDALRKLENDLLKKTDGCVLSGEADKNDWVLSCDEQAELYSLIVEAIEMLQLL